MPGLDGFVLARYGLSQREFQGLLGIAAERDMPEPHTAAGLLRWEGTVEGVGAEIGFPAFAYRVEVGPDGTQRLGVFRAERFGAGRGGEFVQRGVVGDSVTLQQGA